MAEQVSAIVVFGVAGAVLGAVFPIIGSNTAVLGLVIGIIAGWYFSSR